MNTPEKCSYVLRSHAEFVFLRCPDGKCVSSDMIRAAAEIDRLAAENAELRARWEICVEAEGTMWANEILEQAERAAGGEN